MIDSINSTSIYLAFASIDNVEYNIDLSEEDLSSISLGIQPSGSINSYISISNMS